MKFGTEVGLGPGDIVLDGDPAPSEKGAHHHYFSAHVALTRSPISATAELLLYVICLVSDEPCLSVTCISASLFDALAGTCFLHLHSARLVSNY